MGGKIVIVVRIKDEYTTIKICHIETLGSFYFITYWMFYRTSAKNKHPKPKVKIEVPTFNADSAYAFVAKQVSFGPRVISSKGWKNCAIWLEKKFKTYTPTVIVQEAPITTYDGKNHTLKNIIAIFFSRKK